MTTDRAWSMILVAFFLLPIVLSGQSTVNTYIEVRDLDDRPVESVLVYATVNKGQWVTNANGTVRLPELTGDTLIFQHLSYMPLTIPWQDIIKQQKIVRLTPRPFALEELVLIGRTNERKGQLLHEVSTIDRKQLIELQPTTSADAIEKTGAAFVQRSQMGGGSPILRGFEANRILLVVDGIRMNNIMYRSGHLQNSITVGPVGLEQVEIVYGPGSLLYGSDALGGVIHFRSRSPRFKTPDNREWSGDGYVRYGTANQEKTAGLSLEWRHERWASRTSIGFSDMGDLRAGENRPLNYPEHGKRYYFVERLDGKDSLLQNPDADIQIGSAYRQWDLFHKTRYKAAPDQYLEFNLQYSGSSDIPRYDQLNDPTRPDTMPRYSEWNYGPQNRLLAAVEWQNWRETLLYDRMNVILSTQRIDESRITRFFRSDIRSSQAERVWVYGVTADLEKQLDPTRESILKYGAEAIVNTLASKAWQEDVVTGIRTDDAFTRYPSREAGSTQLGLYGLYSGRTAKKNWHYEAGLRYSFIRTNARYAFTDQIAWPDNYLDGLVSNRHALTGSVALEIPYSPVLRQRFSVGTAFRAPNMDDLAKIRTKGDEAQIPNFDLQPENTWQGETTLELNFTRARNRFRLAGTAFYTHLRNAIVQAPLSLPDGSNILTIDGMPFRTFSNINAQQGQILGASLLAEARGVNWGLLVRGQYTYGETSMEGTTQPMAHIPPLYGLFSVWYKIPFFKWQVTVPAHARKPLEDYSPDSSDNPEYATPDGSLAWFTVNLYTEVTIFEQLSALLSVENVFDRYYRTFSSGISAPGRHISITVMGRF